MSWEPDMQMLTRQKGWARGVAAALVWTAVLGQGLGATWDGAPDGGGSSPDTSWSTGQNWVGDAAPGNPTSETVIFATNAVVPDDTITSVLPSDWTVGGVTVQSCTNRHNLDLSGARLTVTGNVVVGYNITNPLPVTVLTVTNGTLQIGTAGTPRDLVVGRRDWSYPRQNATLALRNAALDGHLSNVWVGAECSIEVGLFGVLDLENATIAGGKLTCHELVVGSGPGGNGTLRLSVATGLTDIEAASQFQVGARTTVGGYKATGGIGKIGVAPGYNVLPPGVDITLGVSGVTRCVVGIAMGAWADAATTDQLTASTGGVFTGWIDTLIVGQKGKAVGTLNLSNMTSVAVDANSIQISQPGADNDSGKGYIYLPRGTVAVRNLSISPEATNTVPEGALQFNGTVCSVVSNVTFGRKGTIEARISDTPSGLDLAANASLVSTTNAGTGRVYLVFKARPANPNIMHWGVRWAGNHVAELTALAASGKLAWDDTTYLTGRYQGRAGIGYQGGFSYVGFPPIAGTVFVLR